MQMRWTLPLAFSLTLAACANSPKAPEPVAAPPVAAPAPAVPTARSGLLLDNFDKNVRPQDDLYRFVNGGWLARTEIPADKSNYGSFSKLADGAEADLRVIIEEAAAANAPAGSDQQLIGDFYASFMDEAAAEKHGMTPLDPELASIAAIKDRGQLLDYLGRAQLIGVANPISAYIQADAEKPDMYTVWADQSGLGLPERDYYLSKDARFTEIRAEYQQHIENVFTLMGRKDAAAVARQVMAFETRLAKASWAPVDLRDVDKVYNPFDVAGATRATPGVDWARWLAAMTIRDHDHLIVGQPSYFKELGKALKDVAARARGRTTSRCARSTPSRPT